jgi:hypothetical protein|nr:MAG TPA: Rifin [Caudoviricetes sp.]
MTFIDYIFVILFIVAITLVVMATLRYRRSVKVDAFVKQYAYMRNRVMTAVDLYNKQVISQEEYEGVESELLSFVNTELPKLDKHAVISKTVGQAHDRFIDFMKREGIGD